MVKLEVEVKVKVEDLAKVETSLKKLMADEVGYGVQEDLYFNAPHKNFILTDEALRIRKSNGKCFLTYKGCRVDSQAKTREELEVEVEDFDKIKLILEKLGFKPVYLVRKIRKTFKLENLKINLDNVEKLGSFVEVEGFAENENERGIIMENVKKVLLKLNLHDKKLENKTYLELLLQK
ncbi:MAG: class IV adenylate cyclase [Candidatus Bathyarchaeota archaeon]|nr:class IV adenylate cyclase [Candidatus Bathyarchaeota archaeon]